MRFTCFMPRGAAPAGRIATGPYSGSSNTHPRLYASTCTCSGTTWFPNPKNKNGSSCPSSAGEVKSAPAAARAWVSQVVPQWGNPARTKSTRKSAQAARRRRRMGLALRGISSGTAHSAGSGRPSCTTARNMGTTCSMSSSVHSAGAQTTKSAGTAWGDWSTGSPSDVTRARYPCRALHPAVASLNPESRPATQPQSEPQPASRYPNDTCAKEQAAALYFATQIDSLAPSA
mmetsp:Transcript_74871/g.199607  ORF Transcript_74871/g.199607 Transcript_74871/m.199607 type:complete len:231 (+) Transcript_74871:844-1536(+)